MNKNRLVTCHPNETKRKKLHRTGSENKTIKIEVSYQLSFSYH